MQRWNGDCAPHSGWVSWTWRHAPMHQSNGLSSSPYSSAVREVKQSGWRGRCPAAVSARAIASIAATPEALSNAARNQPSWWAPMTIGAPSSSPVRNPTALAPRVPGERSASSVMSARSGSAARSAAASSLAIRIIGGAPACQWPSNEPMTPSDWKKSAPSGQFATTPAAPRRPSSSAMSHSGSASRFQSTSAIAPARSRRSSRRGAAAPASTSGASMPPRGVGGTPPIDDASMRSPTASSAAPSKRQPSTVDLLDGDVAQAAVAQLAAAYSATSRSSGVPVVRKPSGLDPTAARRSTVARSCSGSIGSSRAIASASSACVTCRRARRPSACADPTTRRWGYGRAASGTCSSVRSRPSSLAR